MPADHDGEEQRARDPCDGEPPLGSGPPAAPPDDGGDRHQESDQVREGKPDREADRDLPRGHRPGAEQRPRPLQADSADRERERERYAAARDHLHVAVLLHAKRRVGEGGARDRRARWSESHLARQQVGPEEAERVGEEEEQVVAGHRRAGTVPDQPGGRVADQRVPERERIGLGPELVGLEEVERLRLQRVPSPRDLPSLRQRVAEVLRDRLVQVQRQRPVHHHRDEDRRERRQQHLAAGDRRALRQAPRSRSGRSG